jgi:hypothetical protein
MPPGNELGLAKKPKSSSPRNLLPGSAAVGLSGEVGHHRGGSIRPAPMPWAAYCRAKASTPPTSRPIVYKLGSTGNIRRRSLYNHPSGR